MTETIEKKNYVVKIGFSGGDCISYVQTDDPVEAYRKAWDEAYENRRIHEAAEERYKMFDTDDERYPHEPVSDEDRRRLDLPDYIKCYDELENYYDPRDSFENTWEVDVECEGRLLCWFNCSEECPAFFDDLSDTEDEEDYPVEEIERMKQISTQFKDHCNVYESRMDKENK